MQMTPSKHHSYIDPRKVGPMNFSKIEEYQSLAKIGIGLDEKTVRKMISSAMDALPSTVTTGSIPTPVQFLQTWLPGFVNIMTAARNIDLLVGIDTMGDWSDEEVVQGVMEQTGKAALYGDYNNVPLASWNANYERRTVVRFEQGLRVGKLEDARAGRANINSAQNKRDGASLSLEINRNLIGFYGYNGGNNRTYGFLNDPSLPAYVTVANPGSGTSWAVKTYTQICADIRTAMAALRTQSQDTINPQKTPTTLAIATNSVDYLSVVSDYGNSVMDWLKETYPQCRVESAPELNLANGGANVFYLYAERVQDSSTDNGRVFSQIVPAKFMMLGVQQIAKGYEEDFSNATAGILCKRPYAVVRRSGI
jgi:hypothetical protein